MNRDGSLSSLSAEIVETREFRVGTFEPLHWLERPRILDEMQVGNATPRESVNMYGDDVIIKLKPSRA